MDWQLGQLRGGGGHQLGQLGGGGVSWKKGGGGLSAGGGGGGVSWGSWGGGGPSAGGSAGGGGGGEPAAGGGGFPPPPLSISAIDGHHVSPGPFPPEQELINLSIQHSNLSVVKVRIGFLFFTGGPWSPSLAGAVGATPPPPPPTPPATGPVVVDCNK